MTDLTPRVPRHRPLLWSDEILDLLEQLSTVTFDAPIYVVGGAVRDALMHRPIHDLDLVTPVDSIKLARKIADILGGDVFVLDHTRGIARVLFDNAQGRQNLDVTLFRGDTLLADLQARDFTINALAVDVRSDYTQIIDPLDGEGDLIGKIIKMCSPTALNDDSIRVLRAVRQSVQLGFHLHPETTAAIKERAEWLRITSPERLRDEFHKLLGTSRPATGLRVAMALGVLPIIIPDVAKMPTIEQAPPHVFTLWNQTLFTVEKLDVILTAISPKRNDNTANVFDIGMLTIQLGRYRTQLNQHLDELWADARPYRPLLILAALLLSVEPLQTSKKEFQEFLEYTADYLRLSNAETKRLLEMLVAYRVFVDTPTYDVLSVHRYWFTYRGAGIDGILLGLAHILGVYGVELPQAYWLDRVELAIRWLSAYYDLYDVLVDPPLFLNGNELMEQLQLEPSRMIGQLLSALREAQVQGQVSDSEGALAFVKGALGAL